MDYYDNHQNNINILREHYDIIYANSILNEYINILDSINNKYRYNLNFIYDVCNIILTYYIGQDINNDIDITLYKIPEYSLEYLIYCYIYFCCFYNKQMLNIINYAIFLNYKYCNYIRYIKQFVSYGGHSSIILCYTTELYYTKEFIIKLLYSPSYKYNQIYNLLHKTFTDNLKYTYNKYTYNDYILISILCIQYNDFNNIYLPNIFTYNKYIYNTLIYELLTNPTKRNNIFLHYYDKIRLNVITLFTLNKLKHHIINYIYRPNGLLYKRSLRSFLSSSNKLIS